MGRKAAIKRERRRERERELALAPPELLDDMARLGQRLGDAGIHLRQRRPPGVPKLSAVFMEFAAPAVELVERSFEVVPKEAMQAALGMAQLAWNGMTLEDAETLERGRSVCAAAETLSERNALLGVLEELIERKRSVFRQDRRVIASFGLTELETPGDFHLTVGYVR